MNLLGRMVFVNLHLKYLFLCIVLAALSCSKLIIVPVSPGLPPDPINYNFKQGHLTFTGNILDFAIEGNGLFIMKNGPDFLYYRRPGSFYRDKDGFFVLGFNGIRLQGIPLIDTGITPIATLNNVADIKIPISLKEKPRTTTMIYLQCNLDRGPERVGGHAICNAYDKFGSLYPITISFTATQDPTRWDWLITMSDDVVILHGDKGSIQFGNDGSPDTVGFIDNERDFAFLPITVADTVTIKLNMGFRGSFLGITNFVSPTTVIAREQDGYPEGYLAEFTVDQTGVICGVFTNGVTRRLFQIPIAMFPCREGLKLYEDKYFLETEYSGAPIVTIPSVISGLKAGAIELDP